MEKAILIVEDDPMLGSSLSLALSLEGFETKLVTSIAAAKDFLAEYRPLLAIFDLNLPDGHGLDLCKWCQSTQQQLPILILTAIDDEETVVRALEAGARDYVRKPFGNRELMARLKAILRHSGLLDKRLTIDKLEIDFENRVATYDGQELPLNRRQLDILYYLAGHQGRIITRDMLLEHLGREGEIFDRTIDSHISQLRKALKKVEANNIEISSIYGVGYRFEVAN